MRSIEMSKNAEFFNALSNSHDLANKADTAQRDNALDALLKADPAKPKDFRKAISSHKAFWDTCNADLMTLPSERRLSHSARKLRRNYYNSDSFLKNLVPEETYSFKKIHQLAAEQRVKLGLKTAEADVLIGILVNNPDEIRAYLASKPNWGSLQQVHGWKTNVVVTGQPAKNKSVDILSDQAIAEIKKDAGELLFFTLIEQSENPYYLTSLVNAADKRGLDMAIKGLGFPSEGTATLSLELLDEARETINARLKHLRLEKRHAELTDSDPQVVHNTIEKMYDQLEAIHDHLRPLKTNRNTFELLNTVQPIHLFNPSFQNKAKSEAVAIKGTYLALKKECDWFVDELQRSTLILEGYLSSLRLADNSYLEEFDDKIKRLRKIIREELKEIERNRAIYEEAHKKLISILQAIDDAALGKQHYNYNGKGIKHGTCLIGEKPVIPGSEDDVVSAEVTLSPPGYKPVVAPKPTTVTIAPSGPHGFLLEQKPQDGWMNYFDVTHQTSGSVESFGRFTERCLPDVVTSTNGELTRAPQSLFEVVRFPKAIDASKSRADLTEAKVNFAMALAAQILANLGTPPTKEKPITLTGEKADELSFLWTALIILGETTPHMKFNSEAIRVNSSTFDPSQEQGKYWGFASNSLHEVVFKNAQLHTEIKPPKKALEAVTEQKFGRVDDEKIATVTDTMRNRLMGLKATSKAVKDDGTILNESSHSFNHF
jgi:hypothetical protein